MVSSITLKLTFPSNMVLCLSEGKQILPSTNLFCFSNGISYLDYDMIRTFLGDDARMNIENFSKLFEQYFISTNIRLLCLSVGWEQHANTSFSQIPFYPWVDYLLSVADRYNVSVFFHFGSWRPSTKLPSWFYDVIKAYPELRSSFRNGSVIDTLELNPLIIDSPLILNQLKRDLKQLYKYYGNHSSWRGISFGQPPDLATYAPLNNTMAEWGFDNSTLRNFFDSIFYMRDIDSNGYHSDGTKCKLWQAFNETRSLIVFSSGFVQRSHPSEIYGSHAATLIFTARKTLGGFKVSWYGRRIEMPGVLILELRNQTRDTLDFYKEPIETIMVPAWSISTEKGWQPFLEFKTTLKEGCTYSITLRTDAGNESNKYEVYFRNWRTDDSSFYLKNNEPNSEWEFRGGGILWIKDISNNDVLVLPFQDRGIITNAGSDVSQSFTSPENITFNTIFLFVSDRPYDENLATVKIIRASDGQLVTKGILRPEYTNGTYWWIPVPLESEAILRQGEIYNIVLERMTRGIGWQWSYLVTDPPIAGPQGQGKMQLFKLAYIDPVFINFMGISLGRAGPGEGNPGVEYATWYAQRYQISKTAPLLYLEVNIEKYDEPGDLIVTLREDDGTGQAPADRDLEVIIVRANDIATGRVWVNVTGWKTTLEAGKLYWVILSTTQAPKGNGYWPWKIGSSAKFLIKRSVDAGKTWITAEPAHLCINLVTSEEKFIVEPELVKQIGIDAKKLIAQSFSLENDTTIYGLLTFLTRAPTDKAGTLIAEIRTDDGFNQPSDMVLTLSKASVIEKAITFQGLQYFDFLYPCSLKAGVKYWLVLKGDTEAKIEPSVFFFHKPELSYGGINHTVKISTDGGVSWILPDERYGDLLFGLVRSPIPPYRFTTEELAEDIEKYHTYAVEEEPLRGWNAYLNIQTSKVQKELIQWFESYTGRKWFSLDPNPPSIIQEINGEAELLSILNIDNFALKGNVSSIDTNAIVTIFLEFPKVAIIPSVTLNKDTLSYVKIYYEAVMPLISTPITLLNIDNLSELNYFIKSDLSEFSNVTRHMIYTGEYFGKEKQALNVLLIGDQQSVTLARYLMSVVNVTFLNVYNLNRMSNFMAFHVIIWASDIDSAPLVTESTQQGIKDFIRNGGGFVVLTPWPKWADEIVGFDYSDEKITPAQIDYVYFNHSILKPFLNISRGMDYRWENKVYPTKMNVTYIVRDINNQPLVSISSYGLGRGILCATPISTLSKTVNSYTTVIINAIFYAARKEEVLPILWYEDFIHEALAKSYIQYSISGKPGGHLLLWIINNEPLANFEIHLNASFFGLNPEGWIALDTVNWLPVAQGQGNDISISIQVNNMSWLPIYVMDNVQELRVLYSNSLVKAQKIYPNQALYEIRAALGQDIWLILRNTVVPEEIRLNTHPVKNAKELSSILHKFDKDSYFYDEKNQLTYIRVKAEERDVTVRMIYGKEVRPIFYAFEENKHFVYALLILLPVLVELYALKRTKSRVACKQKKTHKPY
jgi:hypothetical protein